MTEIVSIIIPTYNRKQKLRLCLDSILSQSYRNIEIIVVDDGSTDGTEEIVSRYQTKLSQGRSLLYLKQTNQGAPVARNKGLKQATGEYVVFFDSDDLMHPDRIRLQIEAIKETESNCCVCGYTVHPDRDVWLPARKKYNDALKAYATEVPGSTQIWMFQTECATRARGYDPDLICHQDGDFAFRVLWSNDVRLCGVKQALTIFVNHDGTERVMNKWYTPEGFSAQRMFLRKTIKSIADKKSLYIYPYTYWYVSQCYNTYLCHGQKERSAEAYQDYKELISRFHILIRISLYVVSKIYWIYYYVKRKCLQ